MNLSPVKESVYFAIRINIINTTIIKTIDGLSLFEDSSKVVFNNCDVIFIVLFKVVFILNNSVNISLNGHVNSSQQDYVLKMMNMFNNKKE